MRNTAITITSILFVILFIACNTQTEYNELLVRVDSLTKSQLDSALHIFQRFPMDSLKTEADSAYYALLMTTIRDKSFIVQTDDSLIRSAVTYYDKTNDTEKQAQAYYYAGCVYRDLQKKEKAITQYLLAQPLAIKTGNMHLLSLIYNNIGNLYYTQNLNAQADSIYQLAEQIAIQLKDSMLQTETLSQRGMIYMEKGETFYPKAEELMLQAISIAQKLPSRRLKGNIYSSLSTLYNWMQNGEKSVEFAKRNLATQKDSSTYYEAYKLLGSAYYQAAKYDSARYYLQKSLPTRNYATKAGAYMRLADIAKEQEDLATSLEMERNYSAYMDSLQSSRQADAIVCAEKDIQINYHKKRYNTFITKHTYYFLISVGVITIIVIFSIKRRYKQNLHNNINTINDKKYPLREESFEQSDIYEKMKRIIFAYKNNDESEERMRKQDWLQLIAETDLCWNNIIRQLQLKYNLTEDEIHLCCLYLTDLPVSHFCHLLNCTRDTVYKKANRILEQRMGFSHKETSLKDVLKKMD